MWKYLLQTDKDITPLCVRIALGVVMLPHGAQKVLGWFGGHGFSQTLQAFYSMGFPAWSTVMLMIVELLGSLSLIAGFLTRIWAFGFLVSMSICMSISHIQHGFFMNWFGQKAGEGIEYHILVIGIAIGLTIQGGGALSLDRFIKRK